MTTNNENSDNFWLYDPTKAIFKMSAMKNGDS